MKLALRQLIVIGLLFALFLFGIFGCKRKPKEIFYVPGPDSWVTFTNSDCKFSIFFPSEPKIFDFQSSITNFSDFSRMWTAKSPDGITVCGVWAVTPPGTDTYSPEQIESALEFAKDIALGSEGNPKLLGKQPIVLNACRGSEFDFERLEGKVFTKVRAYVIGRRVFSLIVAVPSSQTNHYSISAFLDSFQAAP